MTNYGAAPLKPGEKVCAFPGLRKYSPGVRIAPGEVRTVVEVPTGGQSADAVPAVAIRRPSGEVVLVDADLVGRVGG